MKIPSQPQGIMYKIVIIIESENKQLWPLNQAAFRISDRLHTVFLYSIAQLGCETRLSLAFKMVEISTDYMSQNAWQLSDLLGFLHPQITKDWCQPVASHVSYPTNSPKATELGLLSRLGYLKN